MFLPLNHGRMAARAVAVVLVVVAVLVVVVVCGMIKEQQKQG